MWRTTAWVAGGLSLAGAVALAWLGAHLAASGDPQTDGAGMLAVSCFVLAGVLVVVGVVLLAAPAIGAALRCGDGPRRPPAGWYADPQDPSLTRWWDGAAWTAATSPREPSSWGPER